MAENGITQLVLNDQTDGGYDNDGFHPSDKPKKGMTTTTLLNGEQEEPNLRTTENGHIPTTPTTTNSATNNGTALLNGHDVVNDTSVIVNGHCSDKDENLNLNCNSTEKELSKCSLDNKLRHYVPAESDGKKLNSNDTRIAIPEDAVINFNTGRTRLSKNAANSPNFSEYSDENDCGKEKIPLQYFSTTVEEDSPKAIEASQDVQRNGHGPEDHQYSEGGDVVLTTDGLSNEKLQQSNGTGKFEEYFIPVNNHKKYLRGEKLYLTKDNPKLCQNWRRCIICGLISIVIAVAILVGVLAATGILLAESDHKSATASISVAGRHSGPPSSKVPQKILTTVDVPASVTTNQPVVSEVSSQTTLQVSSIVPVLRNASQSRAIVPNALVGEFTILDGIFTNDLNDNTSANYKSLATHIETEFSRLFERFGGEFETLKVLKFNPGSIAVRFVTVWKNHHVILAKDAYEIVSAYIENRNNRFLNYEIDANNLNFIDVVDECAIQNGECSRACIWSYLTLKRICACDEGMELEKDGKTCVPKSQLNITTFSTSTRSTSTTEVLVTDPIIDEFSMAQNITSSATTFNPSVNESLTTVSSIELEPVTTTTSFTEQSMSATEDKLSGPMLTTGNTESTPSQTFAILDPVNETATHDHDHESHHSTEALLTTSEPPGQSIPSTIPSDLPIDVTIYTKETTGSVNSTYDNENNTMLTTKNYDEMKNGTSLTNTSAGESTNIDSITEDVMLPSTTPSHKESFSETTQISDISKATFPVASEATISLSTVGHTDATTVQFDSTTDSPTIMVTGSIDKVVVIDESQGKNISENTTSYTTETGIPVQEITTLEIQKPESFTPTSNTSGGDLESSSSSTTVDESHHGNTSNTSTSIIATVRPGVDIGVDVTDLQPTVFTSSTNSPPVSQTEPVHPETVIPNTSLVSDNSGPFLTTEQINTEASLAASEVDKKLTTVMYDNGTVPSLTTIEVKTESLIIPNVNTEPSSLISDGATESPTILISNDTTFSLTTVDSSQNILNTTTSLNVTNEASTTTPFNTMVTKPPLTVTQVNLNVSTSLINESSYVTSILETNNGTEISTSVADHTEAVSVTLKMNENTNPTFPSITTGSLPISEEITDATANLNSTLIPISENVSHDVTSVTEPALSSSNVTIGKAEYSPVSGNTTLTTSPAHETVTQVEDVISEDIPVPIVTTTPSTTVTTFQPLTELPIENATFSETKGDAAEIPATPFTPTISNVSMEEVDAESFTTVSEMSSVEHSSITLDVTSGNTMSPLILDLDKSTAPILTDTVTIVTTESPLLVSSENKTTEDALVNNASINETINITSRDSLENATTERVFTGSVNSTDLYLNETTTVQEIDYKNTTTDLTFIEGEFNTTTNVSADTLSTEAEFVASENVTMDMISSETEFVTSENVTMDTISSETEFVTTEMPNIMTVSSFTNTEFGSSSTLEDYDLYNSTLNATDLSPMDVEVVCREDQFLCESLNTCLNNTFICDRIEDCPDGFDESNCTDDCQLNFQCENSSLCITNEARCDGIWDCDDGSDEENCRPTECAQHEVMCTDGSVCIKPVHICDNLYNCKDRSDEVGCVERTTCESGGRFFCNDGLCIPWALKCDGEYDCKDKEDEGNCTCLEDEFRCNDGRCLKSSMRCDGHRDCLYGEDELGCVKVDSQNMVMTYEPYSSNWAMLCADDWTLDDGQDLCQELGYGRALFTEKNHVSFNGIWMAMKRNNLTAASLWTERVKFADSCSSSLAASVTCQKFDCGNYTGLLHRRRRRQVDSSSSSNHWPFIAFVSTFKSSKGCVAKILTPIWLITSAECLLTLGADSTNASIWYVRTNIANMVDDELAQNHEVQKIIFHQQTSKFRSPFLRDYDVVMIRLKHPLMFNDKIGAICLPEEQVPSGITCFAGVFGSEKPRESVQVTSLSFNSLAVMLLDREGCNKKEYYDGQVNQRMLCTKSSDNQRICDNDEGTPLICLSGPNKWYLAGTLVYQRYCGIYRWQPDVFSNLYALRKDIDQLTGQRNYDVPYNNDMYVIVPPTTVGPTKVTTVTETTAAMTFVTTESVDANVNMLSPEVHRADHDSYMESSTADGNETMLDDADIEEPSFNTSDSKDGQLNNSTVSPDISIETTEDAKSIIKITTTWNLTVDDLPTFAPSGILNGTNEFSPLVQPNDLEMLNDNSTFPDTYAEVSAPPATSGTIVDYPTTMSLPPHTDASVSTDQTIVPSLANAFISSVSMSNQTDIPSHADDLFTISENMTKSQLHVNHSESEMTSPVTSLDITESIFVDSNETNKNDSHTSMEDISDTVYDSTTSVSPETHDGLTTLSSSTIVNVRFENSDIMLSDSARSINSPFYSVSELNSTAEERTNTSADIKDSSSETTLSPTTENVINNTLPDFVMMNPQTQSLSVSNVSKEETLVKSAKILEDNSGFNYLGVNNDTLLDDFPTTKFEATTAASETTSETRETITETSETNVEISETTTEAIETTTEIKETATETRHQTSTFDVTLNETNSDNISLTELPMTAVNEGYKTKMYESLSTENVTTIPEFMTVKTENNADEIKDVENKTYSVSVTHAPEMNNAEVCGKWNFTANATEHIISYSSGFKFWPSIGILQRETEQKECICNILSSHYVITTLSCLLLRDNLLNPKNWIFMNGELTSSATNISKIPVAEIIGHPGQKVGMQFTENNMALVKLKEPIPFNEYSTSICLPTNPVTSNDNCYSTGWGKNDETRNEFISVKAAIVPSQECNNSRNYNGTIMDSMACVEYVTGHINTCQMEIGASLMCLHRGQWELHGMLTPHILCDFTKPAVYNSVNSAEKWIKEIVFNISTVTSNNNV